MKENESYFGESSRMIDNGINESYLVDYNPVYDHHNYGPLKAASGCSDCPSSTYTVDPSSSESYLQLGTDPYEKDSYSISNDNHTWNYGSSASITTTTPSGVTLSGTSVYPLAYTTPNYDITTNQAYGNSVQWYNLPETEEASETTATIVVEIPNKHTDSEFLASFAEVLEFIDKQDWRIKSYTIEA